MNVPNINIPKKTGEANQHFEAPKQGEVKSSKKETVSQQTLSFLGSPIGSVHLPRNKQHQDDMTLFILSDPHNYTFIYTPVT